MDIQKASDRTLELNYKAWLPDDRSAPILDLGCGDGRVSRFLSGQGYLNINGVDRDAHALDQIGKHAGVTVQCAQVDVQYLQHQRVKFKLIVLKQMIYCVERSDIIVFMSALKDALTHHGSILVEFFNGSLLSSRLTELKDPFIRTSHTEHSMRRLFLAAGFEEKYIGGARWEKGRNLRSYWYAALRAGWVFLSRVILILERAMDNEWPTIYTKSIIAVAMKRPAPLTLS